MSARHRRVKRSIRAMEDRCDDIRRILHSYEEVLADMERRVLPVPPLLNIRIADLRDEHSRLSRDIDSNENYLASMPKRLTP